MFGAQGFYLFNDLSSILPGVECDELGKAATSFRPKERCKSAPTPYSKVWNVIGGATLQ